MAELAKPETEDPRHDPRTDTTIPLRQDCKYSLLVPTSMGIRLTPANGQPMHTGEPLMMQATSAESNVASVASYLGLPVKVLTTFVKGSPIARFIKDNLASRHMDYEGPELDQGEPLGLPAPDQPGRQRLRHVAARGCSMIGPAKWGARSM